MNLKKAEQTLNAEHDITTVCDKWRQSVKNKKIV